MRIGIPQSLLYFEYKLFWKNFFQGLGYEVILSGSSTKEVLDMGSSACVQDSCIPVKLYHGHVLKLLGKCDKVFIPRLISLAKREFICPKFIGLPEMVEGAGIIDKEKMLIIEMDGYKGSNKRYDGLIRYASNILNSRKKARDLVRECTIIQRKFEIQRLNNGPKLKKGDKGVIGLIGHPYIIYDSHINMDIEKKLEDRGFIVMYPEHISDKNIEMECALLRKRIFLTYCRRLFGSAMDMMKRQKVDGIIFITSFACGVDALVGELLEIYNRRLFNIPYTTIMLDEHTGEGGFKTRLEAFLDMVEWRDNNDINISTYG
ncbi:MAG: hypothetical protein GX974_05125 [Clostridiales bacterium]|nr:hypothetical protein [Clostridiales bacterium]